FLHARNEFGRGRWSGRPARRDENRFGTECFEETFFTRAMMLVPAQRGELLRNGGTNCSVITL
ncbi:hypothetical protein, partial [Serratia liquefaciens]|uniref:hypothetical protein n=1 Tax=Serratia liquefaciens TaxID=614 RepID=UPI002360F62E